MRHEIWQIGRAVSLAGILAVAACSTNSERTPTPFPTVPRKPTATPEISSVYSPKLTSEIVLTGEQWYEERIRLLIKSLDKLPEHLHPLQPQTNDVIVGLNTTPEVRGGISTIIDDGILNLSADNFHPDKPQESFEELTYYLALMAITEDEDSHILSPMWQKKVEDISGEKFDDTSYRLAHIAWNRMQGIEFVPFPPGGITYNHVDLDTYNFYRDIYTAMDVQDSRMMMTAEDPKYFIATLSAHYTKGEKYFLKRYSELFSANQAEALYELIKNNLFLGKEY